MSCTCFLFQTMCASSLRVEGGGKKKCHCQLPWATLLVVIGISFSFSFVTMCVLITLEICLDKAFFTARKCCQSCAQLVANHLSLLINCVFAYSLLTFKWAKKYKINCEWMRALNTIQSLSLWAYRPFQAFKEKVSVCGESVPWLGLWSLSLTNHHLQFVLITVKGDTLEKILIILNFLKSYPK